MSSQDESTFRLELFGKRSFTLDELSSSFGGVSDYYCSYIKNHGGDPDDYKLLVEEIRPGSIITVLKPVLIQASLFIPEIISTVSFVNNIKSVFSYFLGKKEDKTVIKKLNKKDLKNISSMVNPVAQEEGSQMNIVGDNAKVIINHFQSNSLQRAVANRIEELEKPEPSYHEGKVLFLHQIRNEKDSKTGDYGVIDDIYKKPVKLFFPQKEVKASFLLEKEDNPFTKNFIVDVRVEKVDGKPILYKILKFHESFDRVA